MASQSNSNNKTDRQIKALEALKTATTEDEKTAAKNELKQADEAAEQAYQKALEKSNAILILNKTGTGYSKTQKNYVVKKNEADRVHAIIERTSFSPTTGKRTSQPVVQIFDLKAFNQFKTTSVSLGYTVTVLYHPNDDYEPFGVLKEKLEEEKKQ